MPTFEELLWNDFFATSDSFSFGKENQSQSTYSKLESVWERSYDSIKKNLFTPKSLRWKEKAQNINAVSIILLF